MENEFTSEEKELILLQGEIVKFKTELSKLWERKYQLIDDRIEEIELILDLLMRTYDDKLKSYTGDRIKTPAHLLGININ